MTIIRCVDVETTGLTADDKVVELGQVDVTIDEHAAVTIGEAQSQFYNPGIAIPPQASAVHHIVDEDVKFAPTFTWSEFGANVLCAHNNRFEMLFINSKLQWIDTYRCALALAPNAPEHKLQTLRYWLKLEVDPEIAMMPHQAKADAHICAHLLVRMLKKTSVEWLVECSSRPALLPRLGFGEHAMKPMAEVPYSYLEWILSKSDGNWNEDVTFTARHHLNLKRAASKARAPQ